MNGEWIILLWFLVGVVFLMKIAAVRGLVAHIRKMSALGIIFMVLSLGYFANVSYTKEGISTNQAATQNESSLPNNSSFIIENSSLSSDMPTWWNGSDTDTGEDGIPDLWEKWTHGNRLVDDDDLDRDSDGLTDLEEFQNQTDPRTADTDGDGFSDAFEVANGLNPTTPEDFTPTEPDADNNGRIDLWENAPYIYGFTDSDQDRFDDIYELYYLEPASDGNFDVVVDVYTTRSAVLTWNGGLYGIVVLPTTGQTVRLRLPFDADTELKLMPAPEGISSPEAGGLWKAKLALTFLPRASQSARGSCIIASNGDISQKVVDTEKTITRFPDEEEFMQALSLDTGDGENNLLKIFVLEKRFEIVPNSGFYHSAGDIVGPFVITNAVNIDLASIHWSASHGSLSSTTGSASSLTVTTIPPDNAPIIVSAEIELDDFCSAQESAEVRFCPHDDFSLDSCIANFSPQLGETNVISVTLPGCQHYREPGWLEIEIMRETTGATQHVAWVDMDTSTSTHDRYGNTAQLPHRPIFAWDGISEESWPLADHLDEFTGTKATFHRAMPAVRADEPVPPPFYTLCARLWDMGKSEVVSEESRKIYVPQVVKLVYDDAIAESFSQEVSSDSDSSLSNVVLFSGCTLTEARQALGTLPEVAMQFIPDDVNIRFVHNREISGLYKTTAFSKASVGPNTRGMASAVVSRNYSPGGVTFLFMGSFANTLRVSYKRLTEGDDFFDVPLTTEQYVRHIAASLVHENGHLLGLVDKQYFEADESEDGICHNKNYTGENMMDKGGLYWMRIRLNPHKTNYWLPVHREYLEFILPKGNEP